MAHTKSFFIGFVATALLAVGSINGEETKENNDEAQAVANQAIAELAAWRNEDARSFLQKQKNEFGPTPEFRTAWALMEVQAGAGGKKAMINRGVMHLSELTKNDIFGAAASYYYGEILYQQKDREGADTAWEAAAKNARELIKENPFDATARFYLGASLVRTKKFAQAREELLLALRGGFDPAMVNHQIGLSYLFADSWSEAKDAFDIGLAVDPRYAPMYFYRAMSWDKLGRKDNMLIDLDQYVKLAPNGPDAGFAKAVLKSAG